MPSGTTYSLGVRNLREKSKLAFWGLILVALALPACQTQINNPSPAILALNPPNMNAGQPEFTLTVTGRRFSPTSLIQWNSTPIQTIFLSQTELTAMIPAVLIQNPGTAAVTVFTTAPGGGTTTALTFTINANTSPVPQIMSINPSTTFTSNPGFTLLVTGTNFVSQSSVTVNSSTVPTTFLNSTSLQAQISGGALGSPGTLQIAVLNPVPGGGSSNILPLAITNALPRVTNVTPSSVMAGGTPTTLQISGTGFMNASVATLNGVQRTTTFVNSAQLNVQLTPADLAVAGVFPVQVINPPPGGGTSLNPTTNPVLFSVNATATLGLPLIVDLGTDGTQANNGICGASCTGGIPDTTTAGPSSNSTGQYVAFASTSTNLVTSDPNGTSDAFLRNTCLGGSNCTPKTYLISAAAGGGSANGPSSEPSLDSTGLFAAFTSQGTNVASSVPLTGVTRQVFWRQICITTSGCNVYPFAPTLISISADGVSPGNGDSYNPAISPDNRYVAFVSLATNLVSNASVNGIIPQVYLRDTCNGSVATGSGATITLSGPAAATAIADSAGNYSFPGLDNGTYTVTPSNAGYSFAPPGQAVTIIGADVSGVDFTGITIPAIYSISGTISPASGGAGATLTLSGAAVGTTTADASGNFVFSGLSSGAYTITPSKTGFSFTPGNTTTTINNANVTGINFTTSTQAFNVSGTITPVTGGSDAILSLSGNLTETTTADSAGNFTITGLSNGTYTITPSNAGFTFSPVSQSFIINGTNLTGVKFTASPLTTSFSISGTITAAPNSACTPTTFLVSSPDGKTQGDGPSAHPSISSQGLFVAFSSSSTNLGPSAPNPTAAQEVFEQSTCVTATSGCTKSLNLVSAADAAGTIPANGASSEPSMTTDGRYVAFASTATNLGTASGGIQQIYERDTCNGGTSGCAGTNLLISTSDGATPGNAMSETPSISQTGEFVAFASVASNLSAITQNGIENIFVRSPCLSGTTGCVEGTIVVSQPGGTSPPPANGPSLMPSLSGSGTAVSFLSFASNIVAGDTNGVADVFLSSATLTFNLAVGLGGTGTGTVVDGQGQIDCVLTLGALSGTCSGFYTNGTSVTLTATPAGNSTFVGWQTSNSNITCTTDTSCTFTMTGDTSISATINRH